MWLQGRIIYADGNGRARDHSNVGEEMKTVSEKRRTDFLCDIPVRAGRQKEKGHSEASYQK